MQTNEVGGDGQQAGWAAVIATVAGDVGVSVEPSRLRDAVGAGERSYSDNPFERLVRTASPLGLRVAPTVASALSLCSERRFGVALIWDGHGGWLALRSIEGGAARVRDAAGRDLQLDPEQLAAAAGAGSKTQPLVVALVERSLPFDDVARPHEAKGERHDDPAHDRDVGIRALRRILSLMRLERGDVATSVIYAAFIGLSTLIVPVAVQSVVNTVAFTTLTQPLVVLSLAVLAALSFSAVLRALQEWVVERLQQRIFVRVALDFAARLPVARLEAFESMSPGERALRFFDVLTAQKTAAELLTGGTSLALQALAGLLLLAFYHPFLLVFDVLLVVALALVIFVLGRGAISSSLEESNTKYRTASWIVDIARNVEAFRMHPEAAVERTGDLARSYVQSRRENFRIVFRQFIASLAVQALASAGLLAVGGWLVLRGQLTVGQLVAAEIIVASVVGGFTKLSKQLINVYDLATSLEKLGYVLDLPLEPRNGVDHLNGKGPARLVMDAVSFSHGDGKQVFDGFHLAVEPGRRLAVFGAQGSGKSTLADLALHLREPSRGAIRVDDVDVRELDAVDLRKQVVVVRSADVFEASVLENVTMGRREIGSREVHAALAAVGLHSTVTRLRAGLGTRLSSGGGPLSFGEAQRLALARALVGSPRLLIVDGLLDGLDPATLVELETCLAQLEQSTTVLVLTSDPDVARFCHDVVRLHRPRIGTTREDTARLAVEPLAMEGRS